VLTIPQVVRATAKFGEREALVDGSRRWSFIEVVHEIESAARAFIAQGLMHGDRLRFGRPIVPNGFSLQLALNLLVEF
jgi:non-ribosomal peptide synthetase component E (peptide arylation enzyme)